GLRPRVGGADRIALVLRPRRAQLGEQLATPGVAQLLAQLAIAARLRLLPEHDDLGLERILDRRGGRCVFGHPRAGKNHTTALPSALALALALAQMNLTALLVLLTGVAGSGAVWAWQQRDRRTRFVRNFERDARACEDDLHVAAGLALH